MEVDRREEGEEAALAAQVLEIIGGGGGGGISLQARPSPEEPEDREGWSLEEGDDSVFYSDEDPTHPDAKVGRAQDAGSRRPLSSQAADDLRRPQKEEVKEKREERQELHAARQENAQPQAPSQQVRPAAAEAPTQSLPPFDLPYEGGSATPPAPQGTSETETETETGRDPSSDFHTLPLPKKAGRQGGFDHLSAAKYSTVSYRRIRRGNTRKKIEDFEYMIMNL